MPARRAVPPVAAAPPVVAQADAEQAATAHDVPPKSDDDQDQEALFSVDIAEGKLEHACDAEQL